MGGGMQLVSSPSGGLRISWCLALLPDGAFDLPSAASGTFRQENRTSDSGGFGISAAAMNRRKETSHDESTDVYDEKIEPGASYPFAFVLRMRVAQIVCGISTLLMGSVALIEEKSHFNMGMGIPAGISTVAAAANSIYCSRGFDGYRPPSSKTRNWARFRFLGPTMKIASIHVVLWALAGGLLVSLCFNAIRTIFTGVASSTLGVLATVELTLSFAIIAAILAILWVDLHHDPD